MTRSNFQFTLGLALGFLSVPTIGAGAGFLETNVIVGAASTMIAPRVWWAGMTAIALGQSAAAYWWLTDSAGEFAERFAAAVRYVAANTASPLLLGAVIGAIAWSIVERRHRKLRAEDCTDRLQ